MADDCGQLGPVITRTTIAFPPGALSTKYFPEIKAGKTFWANDFWADTTGVVAPLDVADLACPTWGLGTLSKNGQIYTTVGPPFNPFIVAPAQLSSLAPEWLRCTSIYELTYGIYDPPYALTPEAVISPSAGSSSRPAPAPASSTPDADPPMTIKPTPASTQIIPFASKTNDQPSVTPQPTLNEPSQLQPVNGPLDSTVVSLTSPSSPSPNSIGASTSQNIGAIIYSAFGGSGPGSAVSTIAIPNSGPTIFTVGGEDISVVDPSAIVVQGTTYTAGGNAATIFGDIISVAVPTPSAPLYPLVVTIGGQTLTVAPSALVLASTTILPGGAGLTISGTPVSLELSGVLLIGSNTIALNDDPAPTSEPEVFSIGTYILTVGPSDVIVDGTTLTAGGAGITISGAPIILEPSSILVVGTNTIALGSGIATNTLATITPFTGFGLTLEVPRWWIIVMILITGSWVAG